MFRELTCSSGGSDASCASSIKSAVSTSRCPLNEAVANDGHSAGDVQPSENQYRQLIQYMPTALWQVDTRALQKVFDRLRSEGVTDFAAFLDAHSGLVELAKEIVRVAEVNCAAISLFHGQCAADLTKPVGYIFAAVPQALKRIMIAHFEGRRNYTEQSKIITLDGETRDVILSVTFSVPPEQPYRSFLTMLDITDRLRTEAQLRQLQADHAHAARISTLGELATSIAHEVNQPLAAIIMNAEASLRWLGQDDPNVLKVKQLTTRIISSADRAKDIVQRIRSLAARGDSERIVLDLNEVTEEALFFVRHDIDRNQIELSIDAAADVPKLLGDRVQLQQVIVNLIINSIQAIRQAKRSDRYIRLSIAPGHRDTLTFSIRDSGSGIADEDLDHVFASFFTTKESGLGIGLAICRSIIGAHGGCISASNLPEGGAQFQFTLPAAPLPPLVEKLAR
jgi:C4-dicarboxylate-specific signal transduction histidine kinase